MWSGSGAGLEGGRRFQWAEGQTAAQAQGTAGQKPGDGKRVVLGRGEILAGQ